MGNQSLGDGLEREGRYDLQGNLRQGRGVDRHSSQAGSSGRPAEKKNRLCQRGALRLKRLKTLEIYRLTVCG